MFRKFLFGFLILAVLLLSCGGISIFGKIAYDVYTAKKAESNIQPGNHEREFSNTARNETSCTSAKIVSNAKIDKYTEDNLDNGDPWTWTLTLVNPAEALDKNETLMVLTEEAKSFDVVYPQMIYSSYVLEGTLESVQCFIQGIGADNVGFMVYVGKNTPKGWDTVESVSGGWWEELTVWTYIEEPIHAGEAVEGFIEPNGTQRTIAPKSGLNHGQYWLEGHPGLVIYPVVEAGYEFTLADGWQGSNWTYSFVQGNLFDRILQSSREAVLRDSITTVVMPYCGANMPSENLEVSIDDQVVLTANWFDATKLSEDGFIQYEDNGLTIELTGFVCKRSK